MNKYLSIITNFGCHYTCPYCIVKNNNIDIPVTTIQGLDKLVEYIRKYDCDWVSISGGGDPLHNLDKNMEWYIKLFEILPIDIYLELHTSYISAEEFAGDNFLNVFDRIVYHCRTTEDLHKIKRTIPNQKIRAVFVVDENFTNELIDEIANIVRNNSNIDELSFRQMVDDHYNTTHYCEEYLKQGHQKDWWYIQQCDYNIYYAENKVSFNYEDFKKEK